MDLRAVTAWALLGSFDWNRMVTRVAGHYEPGVFDVRGGQPRPTLMAPVLRDLAAGREPSAPVLACPAGGTGPAASSMPRRKAAASSAARTIPTASSRCCWWSATTAR
jgi:dTDP-4-dehydrorhamnose reductase